MLALLLLSSEIEAINELQKKTLNDLQITLQLSQENNGS